MKRKIIIVAISFCFCIVSCEKKYCVKVIKDSPKTTILSKSEINTIKSLFDANGVDYSNYLFSKINKPDELGYQRVECYQFVNDLKVLSDYVVFRFRYGILIFVSKNLAGTIDLDTKPLMNSNDVAKKFVDAMKQDQDCTNKDIRGCFDLEFGYYDLNAGGYTTQNFIKAWKITPRKKEYPFAYINDSNSEIIYYFNGIFRD